jgi:hypothetical protein
MLLEALDAEKLSADRLLRRPHRKLRAKKTALAWYVQT